MRLTSFSFQEEARLADLYSYNILDGAKEKDFDDLVELVAQIYGCPSAAITFVDKDRMLFKASKGVERTEIPRNKSVCTHTIMQEKIMVIKDMQKDERFADNTLLTQELKIRFYAGAPIVSTAGFNLGAVCVFDQKPRQLSSQQRLSLKAIANQVSRLLELKAKNTLLQKHASALLKSEKNLTHSILQQQEKQRLSIGTELHENIAQGLASAKLYLEVMSQSVEHPFLQKSTETVTQLLQQVKNLSNSIVPTTLQSTGFKTLLQMLARRYRENHGFKVDFAFAGYDSLKPELSVALYRIAEEAFKNVWLHAKADAIELRADIGDDNVMLSVSDNGVGVNLQHLKKGSGLGSVVSVTEHYGGTVDLLSDGRKGCKLLLQLPLNEQSC